MALVKIMGLLDLLTVFALIAYHLEIVSGRLLISFMLYLLFKGFLFREDPASNIDFIIAIYLLFALVFSPFLFLTVICSIYLFQKAIFSLF